jgi:hypothetical protein
VDFSPEAVDIGPHLQQAGARFFPDHRNGRDRVAVLQQFVHALQHVVWQRDLRCWINLTMLRAHHRSDFVGPLDHGSTTFSVSARDERADLAHEFNRRLEQSSI